MTTVDPHPTCRQQPRESSTNLALYTRLIGFERMTGPYAVAHLRIYAAFRRAGIELTDDLIRVFVADTLADPYTEQTRLGQFYDPIAKSRSGANRVKRDEPVMVVIGNPPYRDKANGRGGWVERGGASSAPILRDFLPPADWGIGTHTRHLYNMNVFFWRWAMWKAFEAHPTADSGVIAFITTAAFLDGRGFEMMRSHMRTVADEIWVIDVTPEGHRPEIGDRIFPGVQQPLAITVLVRRAGARPKDGPPVWFRCLSPGSQASKFAELQTINISDEGWRSAPKALRAPFRPEISSWERHPQVEQIFPWTATGLMAGRNWVIAPCREALDARWHRLVNSPINSDQRRELFVEHAADRSIDKRIEPLPGQLRSACAVGAERGPLPEPVPVGFRSFDRQWLIPDKRLLNRPNPTLWWAHSPQQCYLTFSHDKPVTDGPGATITAHIPDAHHYHGRGGRVVPLWRNPSASESNIASGLTDILTGLFGRVVQPIEIFQYTAGILCHAGYSRTFTNELAQPGVRIPITRDATLFTSMARIGASAIGVSTSERMSSWASKPAVRPKVTQPVGDTPETMPRTISWDDDSLLIGDGRIEPVSQAAWEYTVNGFPVIQQWFKSRGARPGGKVTSVLDTIGATRWLSTFTDDLLLLVARLHVLTEVEAEQQKILTAVLAGEVITVDELLASGVVLADPRKPDRPTIPADGGLFDSLTPDV